MTADDFAMWIVDRDPGTLRDCVSALREEAHRRGLDIGLPGTVAADGADLREAARALVVDSPAVRQATRELEDRIVEVLVEGFRKGGR